MRSLRSFWLVFGVGVFFTLLWVCPALCGVDVNLSNMVSSKGHIVYQGGKLQSPSISFTQIVSGYYCSYGLDSDGTVWSWGYNMRGCLGYEGDVYVGGEMPIYGSVAPRKVKGPGGVGYLTGVTKIAAGYAHALALKSDGTVLAWGDNTYGQLGNYKYPDDYEDGDAFEQYPVQVVNSEGIGPLEGVVDISAGGFNSFAVTSSGHVVAWGNNEDHQLGIGGDLPPYNFRPRPEAVRLAGGWGFVSDAVAVSAGWFHVVALRNNGTVYIWGRNKWGDDTPYLGVNSQDELVSSATLVPDLDNVIAVSAGQDYPITLALKSNGTVVAWGPNWDGQLCQGHSDPVENPTTIKGPGGEGNLTNITKISASSWHTLFLRSDGTVWGCGYNGSGSLAQGNYEEYYLYPVQVKSPDGEGYLTNVVNISGKGINEGNFAITSGNKVYAWGNNPNGQLGIGNFGGGVNLPTPLLLGGYAVYSVNLNGETLTKVSVNSENSENLSFLISPDGENWYHWSDEWLEVFNFNNYIWYENYMSDEVLESLGQVEWADLLGNSPNTVYILVFVKNPGSVSKISFNPSQEGPTFPDFTISSWGSVEGQAPLTVVLSADADSEALRAYLASGRSFVYEWDFGDGTPKVTGKRVVGHTYKVAGNYTVTLTVKDDLGNSEPVADNNTVQVTVTQPEDMTVRHFKVYYSNKYMRVPLKIIIKPVLEYMPGFEKVQSNEWKVGSDLVAQNRSQAVITFTQPGDFNINFSGQTNYGRVLQGTFPLNVKANQLPTCTMQYEDYPEYGYTKFTPSCTDPDGKVKAYFWEFGNGETSKNRIGYAHYQQGGSYTVKLKVKDDSNEEANFQWSISVQR